MGSRDSADFATIPGMLVISLTPNQGDLRWLKYAFYLMTVTANLPGTFANQLSHHNSALLPMLIALPLGLMIWSMLPSNVAGRTKKSVVSSLIFIAYCVGNSIGAQLFRAEWVCAVTFVEHQKTQLNPLAYLIVLGTSLSSSHWHQRSFLRIRVHHDVFLEIGLRSPQHKTSSCSQSCWPH